jgi:hypothetical protein
LGGFEKSKSGERLCVQGALQQPDWATNAPNPGRKASVQTYYYSGPKLGVGVQKLIISVKQLLCYGDN